MWIPWVLALGIAGCGARSGLREDEATRDATVAEDGAAPPPRRDAGARRDAGRSCGDGSPVRSCVVGWSACHPIGSSIALEPAASQTPDLAWGGSELLVVYDGPGVAISAVTLDGAVAWTEEVGGIHGARIAYDVETCTGMVVADSAVRWLGADGRPSGELVTLPFMGWQLGGDVATTASGFIVTGGAIAYATDAPPPGLFYDRLGRAPGGLELALVDPAGPRSVPEHDTDEDARATWIASTTWDGTVGELYVAGDTGSPVPVTSIGNDAGTVVGVAEHGGSVLLLRAGATALTLEQRARDGALERAFTLGGSSRGLTGHMLRLGENVVVASNAISDEDVVAVAAVRPERDAMILSTFPLTSQPVSHSPRLARTPQGFAVAWAETHDPAAGLTTRVQLFECCLGD